MGANEKIEAWTIRPPRPRPLRKASEDATYFVIFWCFGMAKTTEINGTKFTSGIINTRKCEET